MSKYLAGGVDDLRSILLPSVLDSLAEGVLNCGIVALDEMAVDESNGERGLSCEEKMLARSLSTILCTRTRSCATRRWCAVPTDLLPTMAIFRSRWLLDIVMRVVEKV